MNKKIMILGASVLQLPAIKQAKEMGLGVVAVDMNPDAIGFMEDGVCKEVISTIDIPAIIEVAKKHNIDGIMTLATDMPMRSVAAVAKEMNLVGIDEQTALKATNKAYMREALRNHNVPIPDFYRVTNEQEYIDAVKKFNVPFVVKPADSSGSRGIYLIDDLADREKIAEAYSYSLKFSRSGEVVIEEYMSGQEVSVETLTVNGECHVIQITDKLTTGAPHFVEMGHSQPTELSAETTAKIAEVAKAANKAIGITSGPSHTEIMVTKEGPKIVELGARLGGDCITTHLVPLSTGVNMVKCCIQIALGLKPDLNSSLDCGCAIRYFNQKPGIVKKIEGLGEAYKIQGVKEISIVHGVGETVTEIKDSASRMGFVISQADNAQDAVNICNKAIENIKIFVEE